MSHKRKKQMTVSGAFLMVIAVFFGCSFPRAVQAAEKNIVINNNEPRTYERRVTLTLQPPNGATEMKISDDALFANAKWQAYIPTKKWTLSVGTGVKSIYVRFKDLNGKVEDSFYHDTIELSAPDQMAVSVEINDGDDKTKKRQVQLDVEFSKGIEEMYISNVSSFDTFDARKPQKRVPWTLTAGSGEKTVYIQFRDVNGETKTVHDTIEYQEARNILKPGTLIKGPESSVYYIGFDGMIHPFLHSSVFHSWYDDMSSVSIRQVSRVALKQYSVGRPICVRGGTWIIRFQNFPQLYAAETGCRLFPLRSSIEAFLLYGSDWEDRVIVLDHLESGIYLTLDRGVGDDDQDPDREDRDNDGLDAETEEVYGSSDTLPDTDGDGVSDAEEVLAWFTDPTLSDSDSDGVGDLEDIFATYLSTEQTINAPDVYTYPAGFMFQSRSNSKYYMSYVDHLIYYMGDRIDSQAFTSNRFMKRFVGSSSPFIDFVARSGWTVKHSADVLQSPTLINDADYLYVL